MVDSNKADPSENTTECKHCARRIITEVGLYTVCNGPCNSAFHISCVGISRDQLRSISRGIIWLCNSCLSSFNDWKSSTMDPTMPDATGMNQDISELKIQVSRIIDALDKITPNESSFAGAVLRNSTPVTTSSLLNGTNVSYECIGGCDQREQNGELEETMDRRSFSLLLTNIDSAVSEGDIKSMVCRCLDAPVDDCEHVVKLVPKRIDCRFLDYVSFKVVIKWKWKTLALRASTWPNGIQFREFLCRQSNTWKP